VIAAVVLAAGAGSRFGGAKQRLLLPHVLARVRESSVDEIVVVAGAHALDTSGVRLVDCPDWKRGPGASLRCGLKSLAQDVDAAVVCLADGPRLAPEAIDRVVEAWRHGTHDIVAASYDRKRSHPVVLARPVWPTIPDQGARSLEAHLVPCDDLEAPGDVDRAEDLDFL
jgi:CTP:molybdopterin cytidylyltransferase MocA